MDSNKEAGSGPGFWIPSGAVLLSLLFSTWALQREPFINARPASLPAVVQTQVDARLWQDPFDALERYRELYKSSSPQQMAGPCPQVTSVAGVAQAPTAVDTSGPPPEIMIALVRGSAYADDVELRRRIRYAMLAGFKSSRMVPDDEQHIGCYSTTIGNTQTGLPFESFSADPFDPPATLDEVPDRQARTYLFWLKEEALGDRPLAGLDELRQKLTTYLGGQLCYRNWPFAKDPQQRVLKVIGPSSSTVLRAMYLEEAAIRRSEDGVVPQQVEIYSPLATAEWAMLMRGSDPSTDLEKIDHPQSMQLLRTVSDDGRMAKLLLDELALRHVDPALGMRCARDPGSRPETGCPTSRWKRSNRVAILAEWDSFYSRALIESFMGQLATRARPYSEDSGQPGDRPGMSAPERREVGKWVMSFGYLRGLDGRLPDKGATPPKVPAADDKQAPQKAPAETADGNGQLDYLRRLADHIASLDEAQRNAGEDGIGAIGIFGQDTYDKLLALQAMKSRMPTKVYFSTDLDARMLQQGQAQITRNLVLAAPYGLTLTRALQQDVPPFRESLQSSVYIAVMAALSPQPLAAKRLMFDYSKSSLLSPSIYEIGKSGFIALASQLTDRQSKDCSVASVSKTGEQTPARDIMSLRCLQDPPPPAYLEASSKMPEWLGQAQSFFWAGPLCIVLVLIGILLGWLHTGLHPDEKRHDWVRRLPLMLYGAAALSGWAATLYWRVELLWLAGALVILGMLSADLNRRQRRLQASLPGAGGAGYDDNSDGKGVGWYVTIPAIVFILLLLMGYQSRVELTDKGLGEPMFLFEGISSWPTVALRLLAAIISLAALAWAWRKLNRNRQEIERAYGLDGYSRTLSLGFCQQWKTWHSNDRHTRQHRWKWVGRMFYRMLLPLAERQDASRSGGRGKRVQGFADSPDGRQPQSLVRFWAEHRVAGSFAARLVRVLLCSWIFLVVTSVFYVILPVEDIPVRGASEGIWLWSWVLPTVFFQILVFWVIDANMLLSRFIRQLSRDYLIWPRAVRRRWEDLPIPTTHYCLDDYLDLTLIAQRTSAVNRLIYAPTLVMLVLMASRSTLFDNWPAPISSMIILLVNALLLLGSALTLRRCAESARRTAMERIDRYLLQGVETRQSEAIRLARIQQGIASAEADLEQAKTIAVRETLITLRERMKALRTGAFSPYSEEPLLRAVLLSLTGLGGTVIIDALNFLSF
ncbi:hypothetical protein ACI2KS_12175 [Pseudomonas sp. NPDC087358]|uniref:hypothetical protein n=1 Tax=Pseudomonas sp. NPDC087358 TaxID=3364439 RepID=UPI00384E2B95